MTQTVTYSWNRQRSDENCEPYILDSVPQPGTYHVALFVAGAEADDVVFALE
jgi:hypothetical protein